MDIMGSPVTSSSNSSNIEPSVELMANKYGTMIVKEKNGDLSDELNKKNSSSKILQLVDHIVISLALAIGTYIGVISRVLLSQLSQWDGLQHFPSIWAQIVGTTLMGFLIGHKDWMQTNHKVLYTSLTTGLCGSLTTFSSWNAEASMVLLQVNESSLSPLSFANHSEGAVGFLTVLLLGVGMPIASLVFGRNIALCLPKPSQLKCTSASLKKLTNQKLLQLVFTLALYILVTSSIMSGCILTSNYYLLFSLLLGCGGTYIRWNLSLLDGFLKNGFPFGTFLANSIGSMILAGTLVTMAYVAMETSTSVLVGDVLSGIITGFCGSLTTVSTFASQLVKVPFPLALLYTIVSVGVAQVMFTAILGIYSWTKF